MHDSIITNKTACDEGMYTKCICNGDLHNICMIV